LHDRSILLLDMENGVLVKGHGSKFGMKSVSSARWN
jgi:hypothetical protein